MPRLMSFAKTVDQIRDRTKTVTRRDSEWWNEVLETGTILKAVSKSPFAGDGYEVLGLIEVVRVFREPLHTLANCSADTDTWGNCEECEEVARKEAECEGFPGMSGQEFVDFFCKEMGCTPDTVVTRIEFEYMEDS